MKNILSIDDNKDILIALGEICKLKGWKPYLANNVGEGLAIFKDENIDMVIIDYHMPIESGLVGVKKIRSISTEVPILVLTVDEDQTLADSFIEAGASDFALKPIKVPDLISRINVHLKYVQLNKPNKVHRKLVKGINNTTLEVIENYMKEINDELTINEVSKGTGYAYQTVHRYLNYLIEIDVVEISHSSGKKGRPTLLYRIVKKNQNR